MFKKCYTNRIHGLKHKNVILLLHKDIDECLSHECENGATCVDELNAYTCTCPQGFIGRFCQIGTSFNYTFLENKTHLIHHKGLYNDNNIKKHKYNSMFSKVCRSSWIHWSLLSDWYEFLAFYYSIQCDTS